jgi:deoxyribonuclease-4
VARRLDALARLWETVQAGEHGVPLGFCFDTCHAHAAGEPLETAAERVLEIVGRVDLVHANDSRDPAGTGADRHANIGAGHIDLDVLRHMIATLDAPTVVETPRDRAALERDMAFVREALGQGVS